MSPIDFTCVVCSAPPGQPCVDLGRGRVLVDGFHQSRIRLAR